MVVKAEYIWIDGRRPTQYLRSKTKILRVVDSLQSVKDLPMWSFDGSSTYQAKTKESDRLLKPVRMIPDPIRGDPHILVLCEVLFPSGHPHATNTRAKLRRLLRRHAAHDPWFGIEQEYTLFPSRHATLPYGWPEDENLPPQGPNYCGVGADEVYGRRLVEQHMDDCLGSEISASGSKLRNVIQVDGINAEVMPSQWEFQVGPLDALEVSDQLWLARWLLYRRGEDFGIYAKLHPKPMGPDKDWNGAGAHINFSTKAMREDGGMEHIIAACERLEKFHDFHVLPHVYGEDNDQRLSGKHETSPISEFSCGVADRGCSIRIPAPVHVDGRGYLEDRRPAANIDPYRACYALIATICGDGFDPKVFRYFSGEKIA